LVDAVKRRAIAILVPAVAASVAASVGNAANAAVPRTETLALLLRPAKVYSRPDAQAALPHHLVSAIRPYTHTRTSLPVLARQRSSDGRRWLRVLLPGRPNGHAGWIAARSTRLTWTPWHVVVDTRARKVLVYRLGRRVAGFPAVVGNPATPTPRGRFFIEEALALRGDTPGAPYAFALSARSTVFQEFAGGPGQVAIHSTYAIGGTLGTAVSHGCIRLSAFALRWIASRFGAGVPVTIT
jgi:lipoprotein-anchoring transpeptidase ErfK/SrfK